MFVAKLWCKISSGFFSTVYILTMCRGMKISIDYENVLKHDTIATIENH